MTEDLVGLLEKRLDNIIEHIDKLEERLSKWELKLINLDMTTYDLQKRLDLFELHVRRVQP